MAWGALPRCIVHKYEIQRQLGITYRANLCILESPIVYADRLSRDTNNARSRNLCLLIPQDSFDVLEFSTNNDSGTGRCCPFVASGPKDYEGHYCSPSFACFPPFMRETSTLVEACSVEENQETPTFLAP